MIMINSEAFTDDLTSNADVTFSYSLVKRLVKDAGLTLKKVVQLLNKNNAEKTTTQNLSNKLSRDTLKVSEFFRIVAACGYDVNIYKKGLPAEGRVVIKPELQPTHNMLIALGFTDCKSINFTTILIMGAKCKEAANWIEENQNKGMSDAEELLLLINANRQFEVECQPIIKNF